MTSEKTTRRLTAILAADAVGYSRLMGDDDEATVEGITSARELFARQVEAQRGRIVNAPGDSILAEFVSVVEAVTAAVNIQKELTLSNEILPEHRRMRFRIGVNLGDVVVRDDALYGDGVNIAARLEALADAGGICISRMVYDNVKGRLPVGFEDLGKHQVKNIAEPVRAYRVVTNSGDAVRSRPDLKAPRSEAVATGPPMVAVLPFDNLSNDPEQEYFADGITEELITILAHVPSVSVIARNSTFTYKGKAVDVRTVGKEMGSEYVLEGSVRRSADRVRVTAQLLSSRDGTNLWADRYDADLTAADLFEIQDEIANKVAAAVGGSHGVIVLSKTREISRKPPELLRSYDCVLKALEFSRTLSSESHAAARDCLERTVAEDPEYSEGWARLVSIYLNEYAFGFNLRSEPLERAERALRKALALSPTSSLARIQEAFLLYLRKDPLFVSKALQWAEMYPNDGHGLMSLGAWLCWAGRWEDGMRLLKSSAKFNPVLPGWVHFPIADWHLRNQEYDKALEMILRSEMHDLFWYHSRLARAYARMGRMQEAHEQVLILRKIRPDYERFAAAELRKWMWDDDIGAQMEGLRLAGLNVPGESEEP